VYAFDYKKASSIDEARRLVGDDGKLLAGGMTLIPTLKLRLAAPSHVVDLGRIADLKGIAVTDDAVTVKAMTTHAAVAGSEAVRAPIPALTVLAGGIGDQQVRHRGTIGGSVANNDPAADYPAACLGLAAAIVTDRREIAADDFFQGLFQTALAADEIITAIRFPRPEAAAYVKFPNPASRYAIVGIFVARGRDGVRVAVTGAGENGVFRAAAIERALAADFSEAALDAVAIPPDGLFNDLHGTAAYRANLIGVLARRAVAACAQQRRRTQ
jgi:aerobic carbon-monoxide dehydrogenase medium subunit